MILNYRVEICRQCYFKRVKSCPYSDLYIHNSSRVPAKPGGECRHYTTVPWLPHI